MNRVSTRIETAHAPALLSNTFSLKSAFSQAMRMAIDFRIWRRNCRELSHLDAEQLHDVGLTKADIMRACQLKLLRR
jgi:uncharacterized protein YjiS (DUF1127 family)